MVKDEGGCPVTAMAPPGDPRIITVADADLTVMQPMRDGRGCPRWRVSGRSIMFISPADRVVPRESVRKAWAELAGWRARGADALLSDPGLLAYYEEELAKYQAAYDEATRPGRAGDDPQGPPSKVTVTPR